MDRFPDGMHVRLRSRVRGAYLCAGEDGSSVSLTTCDGMMNTAWQVHRIERGDRTYVQLCSAAYGRYLALSPCLSPHGHLHGHRGRDAVQRHHRHTQQLNIRWTAIAAKDGSGDILLCNQENGCYLRANARDGRWKTCSCVTVDGGQSTMMHWTVECIRRGQAPPPLPAPSTEPVKFRRKIMYVQAYDDGNFSRSGWRTIWFEGRSVHNLMLAIRQQEEIYLHITLCVPGPSGRLTPLVVDLPRSEETIHIIVLTRGSPACRALVYPDIPAPRPVRELFPDGGFVRIKSAGCYFFANQDGVTVSMNREAMSPQQVWVVQLLKNEDYSTSILLRGAAYGLYLATEPVDDEQGRLLQCGYEDAEQQNLLWRAYALGKRGTTEVQLRSTNSALAILCDVERIPPSPMPPHIMPPQASAEESEELRNTRVKEVKDRTIWYRMDSWNPQRPWNLAKLKGDSLSDLRSLLSDNNSVVLCTRAGPCGRWTPLFTDLYDNKGAMEILVLDDKSKAAEALVYPQLAAREP